ncbi:MAG TPA: FUSC family protein [Actinocrinis sp.]|nr:FUSC family protein [Actinocrinis sp.]
MAAESYALRRSKRRAFDGGAAKLRVAAVGSAAMLLSFGSGVLLENLAHLNMDVVFLCVVMSLTLGRTQQGAGRGQRLVGLLAFPLVAFGAAEIGTVMVHHPNLGQAAFGAAITLSIWLRRFGTVAARLGTLVALPFIAILITPVPQPPGAQGPLWAAVAGMIAFIWVWIAHEAGQRTGFLPAAPAAKHAPAASAKPAAQRAATRKGWARLAPTSRLAAQMGVSLALAFTLGRWLFPTHWTWTVLTAFIVNSGNRGRGDVVYKGLLRVAGAGVGTVAATLLAGRFGTHDSTSIVVILVVLSVANWLRGFGYGYWAGCVTAVLSLLYGYFGETGTRMLRMRLEEILLGAAIGIVVAWFVGPVKTSDVVRARIAAALAALSELLAEARSDASGSGGPHGPDRLGERLHVFEGCVERVNQVARPVLTHHAAMRISPLSGRGRHRGEAIKALRRCLEPLTVLVDCDGLAEPPARKLIAVVGANVAETRRAIGRVPGSGWRPLPATEAKTPPAYRDALERINDAAHDIYEVYGGRVPEPEPHLAVA